MKKDKKLRSTTPPQHVGGCHGQLENVSSTIENATLQLLALPVSANESKTFSSPNDVVSELAALEKHLNAIDQEKTTQPGSRTSRYSSGFTARWTQGFRYHFIIFYTLIRVGQIKRQSIPLNMKNDLDRLRIFSSTPSHPTSELGF